MDAKQVLESKEFKRLVQNRWSVSILLSLLMMGAYFGFIFLLALSPKSLSLPIGGTTLGIYVGLGLILLAWALTGVYIVWANNSYDSRVAAFRAQLSGKGRKR